MKIEKIAIVYFSPTGTTRRVLEGIAGGMPGAEMACIDLTPPVAETAVIDMPQADCAIIGVPVYSGRVPPLAVRRISIIGGNGVPAVIVAVYGNRAYDDALLELTNLATERGFIPFACAAFIGEHSFSSDTTPIAAGRPDERDIHSAAEFGARAMKMLQVATSAGSLPACRVPGNDPHREPVRFSGLSPRALAERCTLCGICAGLCPSGAITVNGAVAADPGLCVLCHACVKGCPERAMVFDAPPVRAIAERLAGQCAKRREPELFL